MASVTPFVDGEVISAKLVSLEETDLPACTAGITWEQAPQPSLVVVTPESYWWYVEGAGRADTMGTRTRLEAGAPDADTPRSTGPIRDLRAVCEARPSGGLWSESSAYAGDLAGPIGSSSGSSSGDFEVESAMPVPADTAWIVYDRGPYWLALEVGGLELAPVRWWGPVDETMTSEATRAVFVAPDGSAVAGFVSQSEGFLPEGASG
jgi:hypothetical protein